MRRHPRLTRTGRALEVEDGLQVVGLVELQVKRVLPLWEPRAAVRWQLLDQPPPATTLSPAQTHSPACSGSWDTFCSLPRGAGHQLMVGHGRAPGRARG